jgi:hypothetical protein
MPSDGRIDELLDRITRGAASAENVEELKQLALDPQYSDYVTQRMRELGLDQMGSPPLEPIERYYVDKPGKLELKWPLQTPTSLPVPFDALDRKTQFYVLFTEWTRCELEAMTLLDQGDPDAAARMFEECLQRAAQIEVVELIARSYEGSMRVAEKRGDRHVARELAQQAERARRAR